MRDNVEQEIIKKQIEIKIPAEVKSKIEIDIKREILEYEVKTGDLAVKRKSNCKCNRTHDIIDRLDGRIEDVIITPDNRFVSSVISKALKYNDGFDFVQIIQNNKSSIDVNCVKNNQYSKEELKILKKNLRLMLGDEIKINFFYVTKIEMSKSGKIRPVINNLIKKH